MNIRIGVQLHPQHTNYQDFIEAVKACDQLGVDSLWTWDHFFPLYGMPKGSPSHREGVPTVESSQQGAHFEGWTLLTAMACHTKKAEIGLLVACNSYRNPQLVADMHRTIDHISGGRAILGLGAGWFEHDYQEYGYDFGTVPSRLKDLGHNLPIIKARMAKLNPPRIRNPVPIMIGGGGEKVTLKLTAEHAHMWNGFGPPKEFAHKNSVLNDWCQKVGRDPAEIERTVALFRPEELALLDEFVEAGAQHIIFGMGTPFGLEGVKKLIAWREARVQAVR